MTDTFMERILPSGMRLRDTRIKQEDLAASNKFLLEALTEDKRNGLLLAVRARWVALLVIAIMLPFLNPNWEVIYYEVLLAVFAILGWAQLRVGRVGHSRRELNLIFVELALMTLILVVPNPFHEDLWPTAMQYKFNGFIYFFVLLAGATMAYSWRTVFAYGSWSTVLWLAGIVLVAVFGREYPAITENMAIALNGNDALLEFLDPNSIRIDGRIQEVVVFLIVVAILALNGRRNNNLILKQAEAARERANLARHFPPNIVDEIADRDQPLGAVREQSVTILFADIVGFTRLAARQRPDEVITMLREFHVILERSVFNHHGTLDKFLGDGIMATFGTPDPHPDDAANAVRCADEMMEAMASWNKRREAVGAEAIELSIGIHTGDVVLGDIGSERRLEFAVLGDTVNVASRLEALTRELNVQIIVSEAVADAIANNPSAAPSLLQDFQIKTDQNLRGRDEPISIRTYAAQ